MKIGINIVGLFPGKIGGGEQYIRNIISYMQHIEDLSIYLFTNNLAYKTFVESENLKVYLINTELDHSPQFHYYIHDLNLDVWFCPLFHLNPRDCPIPNATVIFDIQQDYFPKNFSKKELLYRKRNMQETLPYTNLVFTISEFSKKTFVEKYQTNPDLIKVTYLDADSSFSKEISPDRKEKIKDIYQLPEEFLIYPANTWPHKNHANLLEAYATLKHNHGFSPKLVFTGAKKEVRGTIDQIIKKNALENDVIFLGYIDQEDMPYVFSLASMLVFPSLFEGFGIPILEGMRVGIPVACSNSSSIPEVAGSAATYFNASDPIDIAEKILLLYSDKELQTQQIEQGYKNAAQFSWEKCAKETVSSLRELVSPPQFDSSPLPLVSIVTPSFNQGCFIKETIDSVLSQDYPNIEYIVMDGGSTDETVAILESYGDKINWVSEPDGGQADAVNKGIKKAKGTIIGWLNSDDTYLEGTITKVVNYLLERPKVDMVYGEGYYIDKASEITGRYLTEKFHRDLLAERCIICQPTAFFRKAIFDKAGGIDTSLDLCMDYELWMRISKYGVITYMDEYLATSRMYEENKTLSRRDEVFKEVCKTVKSHYGYLPMDWALGAADHKYNETRGRKFHLYALFTFLKYNMSNPSYLVRYFGKIFLNKFYHPKAEMNLEGQYTDGWVAAEFSTSRRYNNEKTIFLSGEHHLPMEASPLKIELYLEQNYVDTLVIEENGAFERTIRIPFSLEKGYRDVLLKMPITIIPSKRGMGKDSRELSFLLKKITFI